MFITGIDPMQNCGICHLDTDKMSVKTYTLKEPTSVRGLPALERARLFAERLKPHLSHKGIIEAPLIRGGKSESAQYKLGAAVFFAAGMLDLMTVMPHETKAAVGMGQAAGKDVVEAGLKMTLKVLGIEPTHANDHEADATCIALLGAAFYGAIELPYLQKNRKVLPESSLLYKKLMGSLQ